MANNKPYAYRVKADDLVATPWKNGGGVSSEIAIYPEGSNLTNLDFDWRLSSAKLEKPGDFSLFPGFERILAVVSGVELVLESEGELVALRRGEPHYFSGEQKIYASLPRGPVVDLGLIYRSNKASAKMNRLDFKKQTRSFALKSPTNLFYVAEGSYSVSAFPGDLSFPLNAGDTLVVFPADDQNSERLVMAEPSGEAGRILAFEIYPV